MMEKSQSFLLILAAAFFALMLYTVGISPRGSVTSQLGPFNRNVEVILTGDVMLGRTVMTKSLDLKDPAYPFRKVGETLKGADLVFVNLENPIIENCPRDYEGLIFCAAPQMIDGLLFAGVDVVSLANNHSGNYGEEGVVQTKDFLKKSGIKFVEEKGLVVERVKGINFGFLGFDFVSRVPNEKDWEVVRGADKKVDVLIVGVHWGEEYQDRVGKNQKEWARGLVEAGADVVSGHHTHWVGEEEKIEGKPVYYSLGNFVFDQMWSEKTKEGLAIKLTFRDGRLIKEEKLPIYMKNWAQPEFVGP